MNGEVRQMGRNCKAAELRTWPAYLSNEIGLHEETAVEVSRTSALSRLVRGRFWGRLEDMDLSPSGERANLRLWLEHVAGLGGALEGVGRASPPSPSLSAAQRAASSSQISAQTPAAPRRNAELSTLPVPVTTRVMLPVPAATSDSQPKDGAGPPGALPYIYMAAAALIQIQI